MQFRLINTGFLAKSGFHPMGESGNLMKPAWIKDETAKSTFLSADLGTNLNWALLVLAFIGLIGAGWTYYRQHYRKP